MTKQEIIAELRSLTNEKAFSKLITLSETIGELNSYVHESGEPSKAWQLVVLWNQLLSMGVELCDFVPCDSDGKPLIKPIYAKSKANSECSFEYQKSIILYKEAEKNVIFEGWEVSDTGYGYRVIRSQSLRIEIEFEISTSEAIITFDIPSDFDYTYVRSLMDLTLKTKENPIKIACFQK